MLWTSYFKHDCTSVKVHGNNEPSTGFYWRKWIQNRPCYSVKMKQCLGELHYRSTNQMKEMGEERRKVKWIYVLKGWNSGRKFWVRALILALPPDLGLWRFCVPIAHQVCVGSFHSLQRQKGLSLTQLFPISSNPVSAVELPFCSYKPCRLPVYGRKSCFSPLPFTPLPHTSFTDPCLSKSLLFIYVFKVFIELVTILPQFYILIFGSQACGMLAPQPGMETHIPYIGRRSFNHWAAREVPASLKISAFKAMVFPIVINGCESWTIKKAEHRRINAFELWCWKRLLRVPWTARGSNQSILKEISPEHSLEGLMLKLKLQYFGHLMWRADSFEKTLILGKIEGRRRRGQ